MRQLGAIWLAAVIAAVALTPVLRLPGGIPFRLDDALVFGAFLLFVVAKLKERALPRPTLVGGVLLLTAVYMVVVTIRGSPLPGLTVGAREYLDVARPLKFVAVLLVVSRLDPDAAADAIRRVVPAVVLLLVLFGIAQLTLLSPESNGPLARFSLLFSELEEWHARSLFGLRPYATFHTPTDLGYFMSIALLASLLLREMPFERGVAIAALVGIVISGTRTFLFGLPLLLLAHAVVSGRSVLATLRLLGGVMVLLVVGVVLTARLMSDFLPSIQLTLLSLLSGDLSTDQSIVERLENLRLVEITLREAPWTGIVSRGLFTRGVDSDYFMTVHRYGLLGLGLTLLLYLVAVVDLLRHRRGDGSLGRLALLVLALTFVYGLTQASLGSTRMGVLPFIFLGLVLAQRRAASTHAVSAGEPA
ncbi:MAG TPA: hypothetical protein VGE02_05910 [Gemmatimonadales bacterium]